jgi:hypothetical protein
LAWRAILAARRLSPPLLVDGVLGT